MAPADSWSDDEPDLSFDGAFDDLDDDDPFGDESYGDEDGPATADSDGLVSCPYCGESVSIALDPGSGMSQQYVEDCQVCCRPWLVSVTYDEDGTAHVWVDPNDDVGDGDD
jgi:hypothetical protein